MDDFERQLRSGLDELAKRVEPSGHLRSRVLDGAGGRKQAPPRRWAIAVGGGLVAAGIVVGALLWSTSDTTDTRVATDTASPVPPPVLRLLVGKELLEQSPDGVRRVLAHLPEVPDSAVSLGDEVLAFRIGGIDRVRLSDASVDAIALPYCQNAGVQCGGVLETPDETAVAYVYDTVGPFPEGSVPDTTEYRASKVSHVALYRNGETRELTAIPVGVDLISFSSDASSLWLYPHINPKEAEVIDGSRREDLVPRRLLQLDVATGAIRSVPLKGHPGKVLVSRDGRRLLTGSYSGLTGTTLRLYDLTADADGPVWEKLQPQVPAGQGGPWSMSGPLWSPDGRSIYFGLSGLVDQDAGSKDKDKIAGVWRLDIDTGDMSRISPVTGALGFLTDDGRWLLVRGIEVKGKWASGLSSKAGDRAYWLHVSDGTVVPVSLPPDVTIVDWPPQRGIRETFAIS